MRQFLTRKLVSPHEAFRRFERRCCSFALAGLSGWKAQAIVWTSGKVPVTCIARCLALVGYIGAIPIFPMTSDHFKISDAMNF